MAAKEVRPYGESDALSGISARLFETFSEHMDCGKFVAKSAFEAIYSAMVKYDSDEFGPPEGRLKVLRHLNSHFEIGPYKKSSAGNIISGSTEEYIAFLLGHPALNLEQVLAVEMTIFTSFSCIASVSLDEPDPLVRRLTEDGVEQCTAIRIANYIIRDLSRTLAVQEARRHGIDEGYVE